ncbi:MAG: hypothetical protein KIS70_06305 [Xanthobacteraceae bacterium]|nr:hypothetical protein [Xanthobacteraceae bacterium]
MRLRNFRSFIRFSAVAMTFLAASTGYGNAVSSLPVAAGQATVRLLASGLNNTNSAPVFSGGVEVVLNEGWKTYWRYPGDAGIPPRFDWNGSENVASVEVLYPAPKRIEDGSGQASIGYEKRVIFPLRIVPKDATKPVSLKLKLDFATCEKICIPAEALLALDVTTTAPQDADLADAEKFVPQKAKLAEPRPFAILSATVERGKNPDGSDGRIIVKALARSVGPLDLFAEGPTEEWTLALPELLRNDAGNVTFAIPLSGSRMGMNDIPPKLRLTLVADEQAVEYEIPLD